MSLYDIFSSDGEVSSGVDMDNIDMSLDYDTPELMTSDFFDSVLSLGAGSTNIESNIDNNAVHIKDEILLNEADYAEEIYSPSSVTSDSEKSSINDSTDDGSSAGVGEIDDSFLMSLLESNATVNSTTAKQAPSLPRQNRPTKIILQNPNNKKIVVTKPILHPTQLKHLTPSESLKPKRVLKVHNITTANGRSVLLPLNVKSIKILSAANLKTENVKVTSSTEDSPFNGCKVRSYHAESFEEDVDVVSSTDRQYPALNLTTEEKRLLLKEGIQLPTHYPLTKNEERELKRIRRKIRNKISAQDSRKRKKEYVDGLEERVKRSSEEKKYLLQRIKLLQRQNTKLMSHFSKLQELLFKSSTSKAKPSTCVMVVLLSALLVSLPNIRLPQTEMNEVEQGTRRALLSSQLDEDLHMDEFLVFKDDTDPLISPEIGESENATEKELLKLLDRADNGWKDESLFKQLMENFGKWLGKIGSDSNKPKMFFQEPDIDDQPPLKRTRFIKTSDNAFNFNDPPIIDSPIKVVTAPTFGIQDAIKK